MQPQKRQRLDTGLSPVQVICNFGRPEPLSQEDYDYDVTQAPLAELRSQASGQPFSRFPITDSNCYIRLLDSIGQMQGEVAALLPQLTFTMTPWAFDHFPNEAGLADEM